MMGGNNGTSTISGKIARHVEAVSFDSLPAEAVHAARRALLDSLGVMIAATGLSTEAAPYRDFATNGGAGPCRVLGSTQRTGPVTAAFSNGSLAHALDFGDTFDAGPAHPHAALVPALLALTDLCPDLTVGEFLAALATGSDLACRLSVAPETPFEARGWYPPPLVNLIAAAAACAKALRLPAEGISDAMGLALLGASFPAILKYDRYSPMRGLREAFAARGAVEAALLARSGARGFADPLGSHGGFFDIYAGGCKPEVLLDKLGERFRGTEVSFKPWPACRGTHAYIEAALDLRAVCNPGMIESVEVGIGPVQEMLAHPLPPSPAAIQAKFSIPFTVAVALIEGKVDLTSFDEAHRNDAQIRDLAARVETTRIADWGREHAASGRLTVTLADGSRHRRVVMQALGSPPRPLTNEALIEKFAHCARHALLPPSHENLLAATEAILTTPPEDDALGLLV